jgi:ribosomal protein S26
MKPLRKENELSCSIDTMGEAQTLYRSAMTKFRMALIIAVHTPIDRIRRPDDRKTYLAFFEEATDAWADLLGNNRLGIDESKYIHCEFCRNAVDQAIARKTKH